MKVCPYQNLKTRLSRFPFISNFHFPLLFSDKSEKQSFRFPPELNNLAGLLQLIG